MTKRPGTSPNSTTAARARQDRIGDQLRKLYDDVAHEPVPEDFLKLLQSADDQDEADEAEGES